MTWWVRGSDRCCFTSESLRQAGGPTLRVQSHDYNLKIASILHALVMETITQLHGKFTRSVIVSSGIHTLQAPICAAAGKAAKVCEPVGVASEVQILIRLMIIPVRCEELPELAAIEAGTW